MAYFENMNQTFNARFSESVNVGGGSGEGATPEQAAQIVRNAADIRKLTTDKLDASKLPEAVNDALAQAKASGAFDGADGQPGKDGSPGAKGEKGDKGDKGDDYILTEADKSEIAEMAAELVEAPEVSMKPLTFTGAVNATYDGSEAVSVEIPQGGGGSGGASFNPVLLAELKGDGVSSEITVDVDFVKPGMYTLALSVIGADAENTGNNIYVKIGGGGIWGTGHRVGPLTTVNSQYSQLAVNQTISVDSNSRTVNVTGGNWGNASDWTGKFSMYSQNSKPVPTIATAQLWRLL